MTLEDKRLVVLRCAEPSDLFKIYSFCDEYDDGIDINRNKAKESLREFVYADAVLMVEYDGEIVGGIAGYVQEGMFTDDVMFSVMFFYMKRDFRRLTKRVIKELEATLRTTKVTKIVFSIPFGSKSDRLERYYRIMGYATLETHYQKSI